MTAETRKLRLIYAAKAKRLIITCHTYSPELRKFKGDLLDKMYPSTLFDLITAAEKSALVFHQPAASPPPPYNAPAVYGNINAFAKPNPPPVAPNPPAPYKNTKTPAMPAPARPPFNQPAAPQAAGMAGPAPSRRAAPFRASRPAQPTQSPNRFTAPGTPAWVPQPPGQ